MGAMLAMLGIDENALKDAQKAAEGVLLNINLIIQQNKDILENQEKILKLLGESDGK